MGYILKARLVDLFKQEIIAVFVVPLLSRLTEQKARCRGLGTAALVQPSCFPPGKPHIAPAAQHLCYHMTPARCGITYPVCLRCNYSTIRSNSAGLWFSIFHERAWTHCTSVQFASCLFLKAFWKPLANKIKIYISHNPSNTYSISNVFTFWPLFLYRRICYINPFTMPRFLGHRSTWM